MSDPATLIALLLGGSGILGAIAAYRKLTPERESIIVTAAQGAVVIQTTIIDELQEHVAGLEKRMDDRDAELEAVSRDRDRYRQERDEARREVGTLRQRVSVLEGRVEELEASNGPKD